MSCAAFEDRLSAWVHGDLDADAADAVERHVNDCASCSATTAALRGDDAALRDAFATLPGESAGLVDRIVAAAASETAAAAPVSPRRPWWIAIPAAAAGFLLAWILVNPDAPATLPTSTPDPVDVKATTMATLDVALGAVSVRDDDEGSWREANVGDALAVGAALRTGPFGACSATLPDGGRLRLNANAYVTIQNAGGALTRGRVFAESSADGELFVTTSLGPIRIQNGSAEVGFGEEGGKKIRSGPRASVVVIRGDVRTGGRDLRAGQELELTDGDARSPRNAYEPVVATRWVHPILLHESEPHTEADARIETLISMLGRTKSEDAVDAELRLLMAHRPEVAVACLTADLKTNTDWGRSAAARILSDIAPRRLVPDLVGLLHDAQDDVALSALAALNRLTGTDLGLENPAAMKGARVTPKHKKLWEVWLSRNRHGFPAPR